MRKFLLSLLFVGLVSVVFAQNNKSYLQGEYKKEKPGQVYTTDHQYIVDQIQQVSDPNAEIRNVILMIGDGMGLSQVFSGFSSNNDQLYIQYAKYIGFQKTKSKSKYTTDSAAAGTALATGTKTTNGTLGMDSNLNPVTSILEIANEHEKATGLVAACKITHATPASFIAHVKNRGQYEDIAKFFVTDKLNVFIGGGMEDFDNRKDSISLLPNLKAKGFQVATTQDQVNKIKKGKIAGLLAPGHIAKYPERGEFLPENTQKALDILSKNRDGFFLMVEGSQIDWGGHDNDVGYIVEEMLDFDRTIGEVLKFAQEDGHTLVIITADHETGGLSIHDANPEKGKLEGRFTTGSHTSVMVPVFAYGPGADKFIGIYENTEIFHKMMKAFQFEKD